MADPRCPDCGAELAPVRLRRGQPGWWCWRCEAHQWAHVARGDSEAASKLRSRLAELQDEALEGPAA